MPNFQDRLAGGLWGLLVGDAVGVPYEFHPPDRLPPLSLIEMEPPPGFPRAHSRVPVGTWSDDGAHALALLASLLECGQLDLEDLGQRLVSWYRDGYLAVDGDVFDVGIQTSEALRALERGVPADGAGPGHERANGNGSLMRVLPLALWHRGTDEELIRDAMRQSLVTHGHLRSQLCCALYCLWARRTLAGVEDPWRDAVDALRHRCEWNAAATEELERHIRPDREPEGTGTGYVVDCLHSARLALSAGGYQATVKTAISLGNDTDTTACVAGGIAGLQTGIQGLPPRWLDAMRGKERVTPLWERLLRHHGLT